MENKEIKRLVSLTIICKVKEKEKMLKLIEQKEGHLTSTIYGKGSCKRGAFAQAFGLDDDYKKAIITTLVYEEKAKEIIEELNTVYNFNKENTGIAFGVVVEGLMF